MIDSDIRDGDETEKEDFEEDKTCPAGAAGLRDLLEDFASSERV